MMKKTLFVVISVIAFIEELSKVLKDKKISFFEGIGLVPEVRDLAKAVQDLPKVKDEMEVATDADQAQLVADVQEYFPYLPIEELADLITLILTWLNLTSKIIVKLKAFTRK